MKLWTMSWNLDVLILISIGMEVKLFGFQLRRCQHRFSLWLDAESVQYIA